MGGQSAGQVHESVTSLEDNPPEDLRDKRSGSSTATESRLNTTRQKSEEPSTATAPRPHHPKPKPAIAANGLAHQRVRYSRRMQTLRPARFVSPLAPILGVNSQGPRNRRVAQPNQNNTAGASLGQVSDNQFEILKTQQTTDEAPAPDFEDIGEELIRNRLNHGLTGDDVIPDAFFMFPWMEMGAHNGELDMIFESSRRTARGFDMEQLEGYVDAYAKETVAFIATAKKHQDDIDDLRAFLSSKEGELAKLKEEHKWIMENPRWRYPAPIEAKANRRLTKISKETDSLTRAIRRARSELEAGITDGTDFLANALRRDYGTIETAIKASDMEWKLETKKKRCQEMATEAVVVGLREPLEEQDEHTYRAALQFIHSTTKHMIDRPAELGAVDLAQNVDALVSSIPDWFTILDVENPLELQGDSAMDRFKELLQIIGAASSASRVEQETRIEERNKKFTKEYHEPGPDWPTLKQRVRGGWWTCRTGPDATSAELRCKACHPNGLSRRTSNAPARTSVTEDYKHIMDEVKKAMAEANKKQQFQLKERLQCEREEFERWYQQREWRRQGGGFQPYEMLYGCDVNAVNYRRSQSSVSLHLCTVKTSGSLASMNHPDQSQMSPSSSAHNENQPSASTNSIDQFRLPTPPPSWDRKGKEPLRPANHQIQKSSMFPLSPPSPGHQEIRSLTPTGGFGWNQAASPSPPSNGKGKASLRHKNCDDQKSSAVPPPANKAKELLPSAKNCRLISASPPSVGTVGELKGILSPDKAGKAKELLSSVKARDQAASSPPSGGSMGYLKGILSSSWKKGTVKEMPPPAKMRGQDPSSSSSESRGNTKDLNKVSAPVEIPGRAASPPPSGTSSSKKPLKGILSSSGNKGKGKGKVKRVSWQV
ncbi:hypothetical protein VTK26DRAFT_7137 [Humicola hyalothermophila]